MAANDHALAIAKVRVEEDALGHVEVPAEHLWGAQTERSRRNFPIGGERYRWDRPVIRALGILKKCAALANAELGQLAPDKVDLIVRAAQDEVDLVGRQLAQLCIRKGGALFEDPECPDDRPVPPVALSADREIAARAF